VYKQPSASVLRTPPPTPEKKPLPKAPRSR
jgi:hypothetical protein